MCNFIFMVSTLEIASVTASDRNYLWIGVEEQINVNTDLRIRQDA